MQDLIKSFDNQPIFKKDGKRYLVIPMNDHYTSTEPSVLRQAVNAICDVVNWNGNDSINKVVSEEERGGYIAVCVALQRNLPFSLAKQNPVHLPGEIAIRSFKMSYSDRMSIYLNGVKKGDKVIIIDDIIDSGGTMIALINAVRKAKVIIKDVVSLAEKVETGGVDRIEKETGIRVKTILRIDTTGKKSEVIGTIFDTPRSE